MTDHDFENRLTVQEILKLEKTQNIAAEVKALQENCIQAYLDLEGNDSRQAGNLAAKYVLEQRKKCQDFLIGISYNVSPTLEKDRQYKLLKANALLDGIDIMLCTFAFRDAYSLINEALPLLHGHKDKLLRTHITGASCLEELPHFHLQILRQTRKIRHHIKEAILAGKDLPGSSINDSLELLLRARPMPEKDIQIAHRMALAKARTPFQIPSRIEDVLRNGYPSSSSRE